jgi:hypothetical protein
MDRVTASVGFFTGTNPTIIKKIETKDVGKFVIYGAGQRASWGV